MRTILILLAPLLLQEAGVEEVRGIKYYDGEGFDNRKHRLDLFLPKGRKKFPVIVWIHGGAWRQGDKSLYRGLGRRFAREGIGFVPISYRLAPRFKYPAQIQDCARAFAWVHKHVAEHRGDPNRLFVMGHSAGGHLSALLALHPKFLKDLEVPGGAIKGAIPMSGVYTIPALPAETQGFLSIFPEAFGSDRDVCRDASPTTHVANASAPMLVLTETDDNLRVRPSMRLLKAAVGRAGVKDVEFVDAEERNHISIMMRMGGSGDDPVRDRIVKFVRERCRELDAAK